MITVSITGHRALESSARYLPLSEGQHARLRELGVERIMVSGTAILDFVVFIDRATADSSHCDRAVAVASESVRMIGLWLDWSDPLVASGPVRATWCLNTDD